MKLYSWLMAQCYDIAMQRTERLCLQQWRRELLAPGLGRTLEIGAGTGSNLPHYPRQETSLTLCEPDSWMRRQLNKRLARQTACGQIRVNSWSAEQIKLPDQSLDTVVSTLVLCSVTDQQQALKEISRVLRPGGQLLFIEHVRSDNEKTARWQHRIEPFWRCACGNCHLTRDTMLGIENCGLQIEELQDAEMCAAPAIVRRTLRGRARKH